MAIRWFLMTSLSLGSLIPSRRISMLRSSAVNSGLMGRARQAIIVSRCIGKYSISRSTCLMYSSTFPRYRNVLHSMYANAGFESGTSSWRIHSSNCS